MVEHRFAPRGAIRTLFERRDQEILCSGPAGTGKSRGCLEKVHLAMLKYPDARALLVRQTAVSLTSTGLDTWRRFVIPEADGRLLTYYGGSQEEPPQYRYVNGSRVTMGGMDNPTKIMSSEYDMIFVQEATELSVTSWENLTSRLRGTALPYSQLVADCNPGAPTHFLKQRCDRGDTLFLHCKHTDNPTLYNDDGSLTERGERYMRILDRLTGVRRMRLRDGLWVAAEGTIYEEEWSDERNLIDPFEIPEDWPRYWAIDFGFTKPMAIQHWAVGPDGQMIMYREFYGTRQTVDDWARAIMEQVAPGGEWVMGPGDHTPTYRGGEWIEPRPTAIICDHDAEGRERLERLLGMGTTPADKRVLAGIEAVKVRMKEGRLQIVRGALVKADEALVQAMEPTCLIEEIPLYAWDLGGGKSPKEQPLKNRDHGADAKRYMVMYLDGSGEVGVRWL